MVIQEAAGEQKSLRDQIDDEKQKRQQAEESLAEAKKKNQQADAALAVATKLHTAAAQVTCPAARSTAFGPCSFVK